MTTYSSSGLCQNFGHLSCLAYKHISFNGNHGHADTGTARIQPRQRLCPQMNFFADPKSICIMSVGCAEVLEDGSQFIIEMSF